MEHSYIVLIGGRYDKERYTTVFESEPTSTPFPWSNPTIEMGPEWLTPGSKGQQKLGSGPWELVVEEDGRPCSQDITTLTDFSDRLNDSRMPYHLPGPNSNSATSSGLGALGVNSWQPPFAAPGWGMPLNIGH
jgi:hypothetical protein